LRPIETLLKPVAGLLALALVVAAPASADDVGGGSFNVTPNPSSLSTAELDARIDFITERLDRQRQHAYYWQWGWMGVYGSGLVIQSLRAGLSEDNEHQADYVVSAIKAAGGVARMYFSPHPARNGADPIRTLGGSSREAKARQLAKAEALLMETAKASERRFSNKAHLANVLVNAAGGAIVWGLGAPTDAAVATVVGITVGAANILSAPWYGEEDVADYKARFGMGTAKKWDWKVVPTMGGAAVQVTF